MVGIRVGSTGAVVTGAVMVALAVSARALVRVIVWHIDGETNGVFDAGSDEVKTFQLDMCYS